MKLKITKSQKVLVFSLLVLVLAASGYVLLYQYITLLHINLDTLSVELDSVVMVVENKQSTIALLESTEEGREEMERYFVSVDDPTQFLNMIDAVAKGVGVNVEAVSVEIVDFEKINKKFPKDLQKKTEVALSVQGEWEDVYHFISLLEFFPYAVTIDRATITHKESSEYEPWEGLIHIHTNAL